MSTLAERPTTPKVVAFDTETRGLEWHDPERRAFLGSWADADGEYVADLSDPEQTEKFISAIREADVLVAHNFSFDCHHVREALGYDVLASDAVFEDTDLISRVLHPEGQRAGERGGHGLKNLAKVYLRADAGNAEDEIKAMAKSIGTTLKTNGAYHDVWRAYPEPMEHYAKLDARFTFDLYQRFNKELSGRIAECYALEREVMPIIIRTEQRGIKLDPARVLELKAKYEARSADLYDELSQELGEAALRGTGSEAALLEALQSLGVPLTKRTPTGQLSTDKFALQPFEATFPVIGKLQEFRQMEKFLATYIGPMVGKDTLHPSFWQCGAWTGRMCISAGTHIDAPRDLLRYPAGIPIEDVTAGQIVYSHDADGVPRPRRVLKTFNQGRKRVLKLVWRAAGSKGYLGELKATPCHRVRLRDGSYRRMDQLQPGDQLAYLSRSTTHDGYARIKWQGGAGNGVSSAVDEHRHLVSSGAVTHHDNENKLDNRLENLIPMTIAEHGRLHASGPKPHRNKPCPYTADELAELVAGGVRRAIAHGHDHKTVKRWAQEMEIHIPDKRRRDPLPVNHTVVAVVDEGEWAETYDLEIEDTPCFVANEIAVHNSCSNPNLQNIPVRAGSEVRSVFVPREGYSFVVCDYDSIEIRLLAYYTGNETYRDIVANNDPHAWMAANIWGGDPADYAKDGPNDKKRALAKNVLFAICYGAGAPRVANMLHDAGMPATRDAAKALISRIKKSLPGFFKLNKRIRDKIESVGFVETLFGRKQIVKADKAYVGMNALIQGSAADVFKAGVVAVDKALADYDAHPILFVHDEIVLEAPSHVATEVLRLTVEAMESVAPQVIPPLRVTGKVVHNSYAEAK